MPSLSISISGRARFWPYARREGVHAFTPLLGARKYIKEKSEFDYKIFDKAWRFFGLGHQNFVDSLPENIKVIYDNFGQNPLLEKKYEARWGLQRTNLVVDVICRALYSEAETALGTLENEFYNMKQLDNQTGHSYVRELENKRLALLQYDHKITDRKLRSRVMNNGLARRSCLSIRALQMRHHAYSLQKLITTIITQVDHRIAQRREALKQQLREERKNDRARLGQGAQRDPRSQQQPWGKQRKPPSQPTPFPRAAPSFQPGAPRNGQKRGNGYGNGNGNGAKKLRRVRCHNCWEHGHLSYNCPNPTAQRPQPTSSPSPPAPTPPPRAKPVAAVLQQSAHYEDQIGIMEGHEYPVAAVQASEGDREVKASVLCGGALEVGGEPWPLREH